MKISALAKIGSYFRYTNEWVFGTAERSLDQAYKAALTIQSMEDEHFGGDRIRVDPSRHSASVSNYFQTELKKQLNTAKIRLAEFKTSSSILGINLSELARLNQPADRNGSSNGQYETLRDRPAIVLEKLRFIDQVLERYAPSNSLVAQSKSSNSNGSTAASQSLVPVASDPNSKLSYSNATSEVYSVRSNSNGDKRYSSKSSRLSDVETITDKTGVLPRSILGTVNRIKRDLDPAAEEEVVRDFRDSKNKTIISLRFILVLIIVPLLVQQVSKSFVVGPVVDHFRAGETVQIFLNDEMKEEALHELKTYEEGLRFESYISHREPLSEKEIEEKLKEKASEISEEYKHEGSSAIKNVFADLFALIAFTIILLTNQKEIELVKGFIDEIIYGLSDSAKAFIIILFTDIFVGFHSPHGWEVLLEGVSRHLGLPANRDFIFLFIATFPVILDTVFKYWIFRYLNRISPSAVATYRSMNE